VAKLHVPGGRRRLFVNGDPLRCERDAQGRCIEARPCGTLPSGLPDDCLAPVEERAWSSPIFVDHRAS
jgi:hypothetical protein